MSTLILRDLAYQVYEGIYVDIAVNNNSMSLAEAQQRAARRLELGIPRSR